MQFFGHLREELESEKVRNPDLEPEIDAVLVLLPDLSPIVQAAFVRAFYSHEEARSIAEHKNNKLQVYGSQNQTGQAEAVEADQAVD